jgi:hypothetical protein
MGREGVSPAEARYPSGKGEVCKTFMRRFDSDPRLHRFNHFQSMLKKLAAVWLPKGLRTSVFQLRRTC